MRAREYLYEDSRTTHQKLQELIDHPATEETVRSVARAKLALLSPAPSEPQRTLLVTTNVSGEDMARPFLSGVSLGDLYDRLCGLSPAPSEIQFGRQGVIRMMVPPPFMGKTKSQYVAEIARACPGCRDISSSAVGPEGYWFSIAFL